MSLFGLGRGSKREPELRRSDVPYVSAVDGAQIVEPAPAAMYAVYLLLALVALSIAWAALAKVDIVTRANGRVVPDGREQVIASLEGGILRQMLVREGQQVQPRQPLAVLDPTRAEAQQAEGLAKRLALKAAVARLQAESSGQALKFPPDVQASRAIVHGETESFQARQRALDEAVASTRRSVGLLQKELGVAEAMAAKGLMSEVEVMRLRRQVNDQNLQAQERINRFRQDATAELVKVRTELALLEEQLVVRDDMLRRTTLTSPVRGVVKQVRNNTVGGVIAPGAPLIEILPLGPRVLVEARILPKDIGFVRVGQPVEIKLSAYEYMVFGGLKGRIYSISPDALGDPDRASGPEGTYYRALVQADTATLDPGGRNLPVLPGMTGTVEVRTGQRSVLAFVLRPMLKSQEAFRER